MNMQKHSTLKMMTLFILLLIIVLILVLIFYTGKSSKLQATSKSAQTLLVKKGEYLAQAGDCIACHTASAGAKFAGGLGIASPIGTIYSTNITPDKITGIGKFTLQDFDNAVRYGIRKDGTSLYPAMPFPSYANITDEDIEALYAYFMHLVKPVAQANKTEGIIWPLSMRWPLTGWRLMFAPKITSSFRSTAKDPIIQRGAYLVQALGHCGTCHTPRSLTLNEKAYSEKDNNTYLAGSSIPINGWNAINLRGDYKDGLGSVSQQELVKLLKTGRNQYSAVFGGMAEVVTNSLQYLTDQDLIAIAAYLKSLPAVNSDNQPFVYDPAVANALRKGDDSKRGASVYIDNCAACHRTDGKGYANTFPKLAGNPVIQNKNPASLINIILQGHTLKGTVSTPTIYTMPSLKWRLNDGQIADVVSFIRTSWGNQGTEIDQQEVQRYRSVLPKNEPQKNP